MSNILQQYRAFGLYSSEVPIYVGNRKDNKNFIYSAVGKMFNVFKTKGLGLVNTSDILNEEILSICGGNNTIYCGTKEHVYVFKRGKIVKCKMPRSEGRNWTKLIEINNEYLVGLSDATNQIYVWTIPNNKLWRQIGDEETKITSILEVTGVELSLILIGYKDKPIQIVDLHSGEEVNMSNVEDFKNVIFLYQYPNTTNILIGDGYGRMIIYNLKSSKILGKAYINHLGVITAGMITGGEDESLKIIVGTNIGNIVQFTLDKSDKISQNWIKTNACKHDLAVTSIVMIEDKILVSGADNSLIYYTKTGAGESLVQYLARQGHSNFVKSLKFGRNNQLISADSDNKICVSDVTNSIKNYSIGTESNKVIGDPFVMDLSLTTYGNWDNFVMGCKNSRNVFIYDLQRKTKGLNKKLLVPENHDNVTALAVSGSGDYCFVGYENGSVVLFNLQSAQIRFKKENAHRSSVKGVVLVYDDNGMISIGNADKKIIKWAYTNSLTGKAMKEEKQLILENITSIMTFSGHTNNDTFAVAAKMLGDFNMIYIINSEELNIIRKFPYHSSIGEINCMRFFNKSDHLIVASQSQLRIYDISNDVLVDFMLMEKPIAEIAIDYEDLFVGFAFDGCKGIYVWKNRMNSGIVNYKNYKIDYLCKNRTTEKLVSMPVFQTEEIVDIDVKEDEEIWKETKTEIENYKDFKKNLKASKHVMSTEHLKFSGHTSIQLNKLVNLDYILEIQASKTVGMSNEASDIMLGSLVSKEQHLADMMDNKIKRKMDSDAYVEDMDVADEEGPTKSKKPKRLDKYKVENLFNNDDRINEDTTKYLGMPISNINAEMYMLMDDMPKLHRFLTGVFAQLNEKRNVDVISTVIGMILSIKIEEIFSMYMNDTASADDEILLDNEEATEEPKKSERQQLQDIIELFIQIDSILQSITIPVINIIDHLKVFFTAFNEHINH